MEARDYLLTSFIFIWSAASRYGNEFGACASKRLILHLCIIMLEGWNCLNDVKLLQYINYR